MSLLLALQGDSPPAAAPFVPAEIQNPVRRSQAGEFTLAANLLLTVLAVAAVAPFSQTDWPNPTRSATASQADTWPNLLTGTLAAQVAAPFVPIDWQNPQGAYFQIGQFDSGNLLESTLAPDVVAGDPFFQAEWVNPMAVQYPSDLHWTAGNLLGTTLTPEAGAVSEWIIRARRRGKR